MNVNVTNILKYLSFLHSTGCNFILICFIYTSLEMKMLLQCDIISTKVRFDNTVVIIMNKYYFMILPTKIT